MTINAIRTQLTNQGWEVVSFNTRDGRYYHAENTGIKRSIEGNLQAFKAKAQVEIEKEA